MPLIPEANWQVLFPQAILALAVVLVLAVELAVPHDRSRRQDGSPTLATLAFFGALAALAALNLRPEPAPGAASFGGMQLDDGPFRAFGTAILLPLLLVLTASDACARRGGYTHLAEYYALLLAAALGMLIMAAAGNLMSLFLGLELFSLALYILCVYPVGRLEAQEAAMKYFLLSSFASAILLYGMALLYGACGSTSLEVLARAPAGSPLLIAGSMLCAAGLAFKVAAVPFHMWAPDVYQGAPAPVTAFMSVATKAAALAALYRLFPGALHSSAAAWAGLLWALCLATVLVGNLAALPQTDLKRLLAYSSIAHGAYMLMAPIMQSGDGLAALLYYLLVYAFMNVGAFGVVMWLENGQGQGADLDRLAGLASRRPALAAATAVLMLSLAGLPPTGGFFAKLYLFTAAVSAGYPSLAVVGVVGSLLGAYYYLRVVLVMYMREPGAQRPPEMPRSLALVLAVCVAGSLLTGLFAQAPLEWVRWVGQSWAQALGPRP
jgi:NADH-quinone oxidoreductase subunit N